MLELEGVRVRYGGARVIRGLSMSVSEGDIVCLIGANGAGKTTVLRTISGLKRAEEGAIWREWDERTLVELLSARIGVGLGLSDPVSPLRYTHRVRADGQEVVFVINDGQSATEEPLSLPFGGPVELWDPMSGEVRILESGQETRLHFKAYQGVLFVGPAACPTP